MSGHAKEPWYVSAEIECQPGLPRRTRHRIYRKEGAFGNPAACDRAEDAARIVACVNALEGIDDPCRALDSAKMVLREVVVHLAADYSNVRRSVRDQDAALLLVRVKAALANLGGAR